MKLVSMKTLFRAGMKLSAATLFAAGVGGFSTGAVLAMGSDSKPAPKPSQSSDSKSSSHKSEQSKKHDKTKSAQQKKSDLAPAAREPWREDYEVAVAKIWVGEYAQAHDILVKLEDTGHADVLNYIGYTSRQMGDQARAEHYYQAALKANPRHTGVYEYYGELKVIQGRIEGARAYLAKLEQLCGSTDCEPYEELRKAIEKAGYTVH